MKITKIKRIASTSRYHVYTDEKYCGIFLDEILARYNLKTDVEYDEDNFKKIKAENDEKVSFDMAVGYLEKYRVSEKGIKDYLKKKGFEEKTIQETLKKLKDYNLINDEVFAREYFLTLSNSKGKIAIANKLREKGIKQEIINSLLENVDENEEIEKATALAEKFVKNRENTPKNKQKCLAHLVYKGYDFSVAQQATKNAFSNKGENNESWD